MPWTRLEDHWMDGILAALEEAGSPWPTEACLLDLRRFQGECLAGSRKRFPTSAWCAKRWGWSKTTAYRLIKAEEWKDPYKADKWAEFTAKKTKVERKRNKSGMKVERNEKGKRHESPDSGTKVEQEWNESGHTHVGDTDTDTDTLSPPYPPQGESMDKSRPLWSELHSLILKVVDEYTGGGLSGFQWMTPKGTVDEGALSVVTELLKGLRKEAPFVGRLRRSELSGALVDIGKLKSGALTVEDIDGDLCARCVHQLLPDRVTP